MSEVHISVTIKLAKSELYLQNFYGVGTWPEDGLRLVRVPLPLGDSTPARTLFGRTGK